MNMGMGLSMGQSVRQELTITHRLSLTERLGLRLQLIEALDGGNYRPKAQCPKCRHELSDAEILKGFNRDPEDVTTKCPISTCGERMQARLLWKLNVGNIELMMFCPTQTTHALQGKEGLDPKEIEKWNPSVYHSAITHFGTLKAAFASMGVKYGFKERADWCRKVESFLGEMPDTLIAECVGVSSSTIGRWRRNLGIKTFVGVE